VAVGVPVSVAVGVAV
jgi:hypothetical protein